MEDDSEQRITNRKDKVVRWLPVGVDLIEVDRVTKACEKDFYEVFYKIYY